MEQKKKNFRSLNKTAAGEEILSSGIAPGYPECFIVLLFSYSPLCLHFIARHKIPQYTRRLRQGWSSLELKDNSTQMHEVAFELGSQGGNYPANILSINPSTLQRYHQPHNLSGKSVIQYPGTHSKHPHNYTTRKDDT